MTVSQASVTTNLDEALDIKIYLFSELPLNFVISVNDLPEAIYLFLGKVTDFDISTDPSLG